MRKFLVILLPLLSFFAACDRIDEDRTVSTQFFPANAVYAVNAKMRFDDTVSICYRYTGNDTIAFGKPCVILWSKIDSEEAVMTFIHEDAGKVYIHASSENAHLNPEWTLLYDFSLHPWQIDDKITWNSSNGLYTAPITKLGTLTLCNGEKVQVAEESGGNRLIYGLGYEDAPFFTVKSGALPQDGTRYIPLSFHRNGELLWDHDWQ
jgi:hypothetical protein